ncbi:MerR family transcriptional regulator [Streptomyces sp. NPDC058308]|uniref:MerR family transcriptional regulator n=1 Tax=Streptomyces sp. NPDC058308 TaxID=3346440 RepID=UPI0036E89B4C
MRIGELAARTGVSVRALRYYEEQDLLDAERSPRGQRHYSESAVGQVQMIQQLYAAGLPSKTIVELMPSVIAGRATPALLKGLAAEREHVEQRLIDLTHTRDRLDSVIAAATSNMLTGTSCRQSTPA